MKDDHLNWVRALQLSTAYIVNFDRSVGKLQGKEVTYGGGFLCRNFEKCVAVSLYFKDTL